MTQNNTLYTLGSITIDQAPFNRFHEIRNLLALCGISAPCAIDHPVIMLGAFESDGALVGCLGWELHGDVAVLRCLAVSPLRRRHGLATRLVQCALRKLHKRSIRKVLAFSNSTTAALIERLGFRKSSDDEPSADLLRNISTQPDSRENCFVLVLT
jgi:N-acetylglutamate synthase-like GNAT family acetyltransferase